MSNKQRPEQRPHAPEGCIPYVVKFIIGNLERIAYLFPTLEDVANGVLFSSPNGDNTQLTAQLPGGGTVTIPFSRVLMIEEYKVTSFNGQTSKVQTVSQQGLERILDAATDRRTGEVKGNIRSIEQVGNPENRVTKRRGELNL